MTYFKTSPAVDRLGIAGLRRRKTNYLAGGHVERAYEPRVFEVLLERESESDLYVRLRKGHVPGTTVFLCSLASPGVAVFQMPECSLTFLCCALNLQMDSGGPVLWQNPTSRRLVLVGAISYGGVCGVGSGVNTRVGGYIDWIFSVTPGNDFTRFEGRWRTGNLCSRNCHGVFFLSDARYCNIE